MSAVDNLDPVEGGVPVSAVDNLDPLVWTTDEAARLLTVSRTTVRSLVDEGRLDGFRIGRRLLIPKVALEAFVAKLGGAS